MSADICVIVPCRNEAADIGGCIHAIANQDLDRSEFEVLLVDGESTDETVQVATAVADREGLDLRVLVNPGRTAAAALNLGLSHTDADFLVRVDARSRISPGHLRICRSHLRDPRIGVAGGGQRAVARAGAGVQERGIVRALSNRYTTGLARYRRSDAEGPTDTVWMGCFRRRDVAEAGGWPLHPPQNQDFRLNRRLRRGGLQVWFDPRLTAEYLPRRTFRDLATQYRNFGRAKGTVWRTEGGFTPRHAVLLAAPIGLGAGLSVIARRRGVGDAAVVAAVGLFAADALGSRGSASIAERASSVIATVVADGSWLTGVIEGVAGR